MILPFRSNLRLLQRRFQQQIRWSSKNSVLSSHTSRAFATPQINIVNGDFVDQKYKLDNVYHNFKCVKIDLIPDFEITSYLFQHVGTKSELLYLHRKDPNNVFSINFRTTPFNSSGLPHILEHLVLCGSKNFPVRDPFFKMLTRSVATFMNAMTGPDYTIYPFSSMNETDYRNLQKIYLDAVFKPNLHYLDFLQEGWRLEHKDIYDKNSEYVIKGVVYNEMKGAFSENSSIFAQHLLNSILPDHTYGHVSGGNPLEIPKLKHEDLVNFHKKYYHPSNARFFVYGNFNLDQTLKYVNEEYLSKYEYLNNSYSRIPNQKRWIEPRNVHVSSRFDKLGAPFEKQNQISISLLTSDITNTYETFIMTLLSSLLLKGPNSYFYKSLIEPNFSGGYNQTTGYDSQIKDTLFTVGLQDLKVDDFPKVQKIFDETITKAIEEGFKQDHIESVLHNIELSCKHQTPKFGLGLLFNLTPVWNHEGDLIDSLKVSSLVKRLRDDLENDPKFFQNKMERYIAKNNHRLILTMSPDEQYEMKFREAEQMLIKDKVDNLKEEDKEKIYENGRKLEESQKKPPNLSVLPCLSSDDVKDPPDYFKMEIQNIENVRTQICNVQTNDVSYLKLLFNANHLTKDETKLIPFFCDVIQDMGTKECDYRTMNKLFTTYTSGIGFQLHFEENIFDNATFNVDVLTSIHSLTRNIDKMYELVADLLKNFAINDPERISMLLETYLSNISQGIADSGHLYAMLSCNGLVSDSAKLKSLLSGLEHIEYMRNLAQNTKIEDIMERLSAIGNKLFNVSNLRSAINSSDKNASETLSNYEKFLTCIPKDPEIERTKKKINFLEPTCEHHLMNVPVNYCAKSFLAVPYTHNDHPGLRILAKLLSSKYLLPVVREHGGAYGAGAKIGTDGIFSFFSYRDPNSRVTLDVFDNTYNWLEKNRKEINEQSLFEAKLGVLQAMDSPVAPGNKGIDHFLYGLTQEAFREYRQRMLDVNTKDLKSIIEKYFKSEPRHYGKFVLGPENEKLEKKGEKWTVHGGS